MNTLVPNHLARNTHSSLAQKWCPLYTKEYKIQQTYGDRKYTAFTIVEETRTLSRGNGSEYFWGCGWIPLKARLKR